MKPVPPVTKARIAGIYRAGPESLVPSCSVSAGVDGGPNLGRPGRIDLRERIGDPGSISSRASAPAIEVAGDLLVRRRQVVGIGALKLDDAHVLKGLLDLRAEQSEIFDGRDDAREEHLAKLLHHL